MINSIIGGKYRIVRLLGAGGMGSVYEAVDDATGRRVALKVVTAALTKDSTLMGRFEREAKTAGATRSPHIVEVVDAGHDAASDLPFMAMEFLEGEDVAQLLKRLGPLPIDLALRITAQACLGLEKAHAERIVHRDIKPANLFLTKDGASGRVVKILDFGIAKIKGDATRGDEETAGLTRTGNMIGSPLYMSPEQARGLKDIDYRADIWSLGVVLYKALCGRTPILTGEALGDIIVSICTQPPPPVQDFAPWVPPEIAAIVERALQLSPADRFQSAGEMRAAMMPFLNGGVAITEPMLRRLTDAERSVVAPRSPDASEAADLAPPTVRPTPAPRAVDSSPGGNSIGAYGTTVGRSPRGPEPEAPRRSSLGLIVAAAVAATLGGGFAIYRLTQPPPAPITIITPPTTTTMVVTAAPAPQARSVKLVVLPEDAAVELEGAPITPKDGTIELRGTLGSVHHVRLSAGGDEASFEVVITEGGALPPKVQLTPKAKASTVKPAAPQGPAPHGASRPGPSAPALRINR